MTSKKASLKVHQTLYIIHIIMTKSSEVATHQVIFKELETLRHKIARTHTSKQ